MNFKVKKIRKKESQKLIRKSFEGSHFSFPKIRIKISFISVVFILAIIMISVGIAKTVNKIDASLILKVVGSELKKDTYGHTNILLLGTGDKDHSGSDLTDTVIVASISEEENTVTLISIPRDLYVKDTKLGSSRINQVYSNALASYNDDKDKALDYTRGKVEEIVGVPIHYWLKINFQGFRDLVDALGGVEIEVKEAIYDPFYPKDETIFYETFELPAGLTKMDGETALKFARSRKTSSDFSRSERQQQLMYAIKEQALKTEVILSPEKINNLLQALKKNIETNITVNEIFTLGSLAGKLSEDRIVQRLIHDDPSRCGGFLYTPLRELFGGAFVLIPAGGAKEIHNYANIILNNPLIGLEGLRVQVLNGTKRGGVAGEQKQILQRYCFDVTRYGNGRSQKIEKTTYFVIPQYDEEGNPIEETPLTVSVLQQLIPGEVSFNLPQEYADLGYGFDADIILELGADYVNSPKYIKDSYYSIPPAMLKSPDTQGEEGAVTEEGAQVAEEESQEAEQSDN